MPVEEDEEEEEEEEEEEWRVAKEEKWPAAAEECPPPPPQLCLALPVDRLFHENKPLCTLYSVPPAEEEEGEGEEEEEDYNTADTHIWVHCLTSYIIILVVK